MASLPHVVKCDLAPGQRTTGVQFECLFEEFRAVHAHQRSILQGSVCSAHSNGGREESCCGDFSCVCDRTRAMCMALVLPLDRLGRMHFETRAEDVASARVRAKEG